MRDKLYYLVLLFLRIFRLERSKANDPLGTFLVITLPAPILEANSKVGAGSVITKNIPKNSLALERSGLKILRNKRTK